MPNQVLNAASVDIRRDGQKWSWYFMMARNFGDLRAPVGFDSGICGPSDP